MYDKIIDIVIFCNSSADDDRHQYRMSLFSISACINIDITVNDINDDKMNDNNSDNYFLIQLFLNLIIF